jgi:hypothetical protein
VTCYNNRCVCVRCRSGRVPQCSADGARLVESLSPTPSMSFLAGVQATIGSGAAVRPPGPAHHAAPAPPAMIHEGRSAVGRGCTWMQHGCSIEGSVQALRCTPGLAARRPQSFRIREPGASIELSRTNCSTAGPCYHGHELIYPHRCSSICSDHHRPRLPSEPSQLLRLIVPTISIPRTAALSRASRPAQSASRPAQS